MEKDHKQEEIIKLFNKALFLLTYNKVSFEDWYNLNKAFEKLISQNKLNTNYMLRYATVLYTSEVIILFDEEKKLFEEKTKQLSNLIETIISKKAKTKKYDNREIIYQEIYLKQNSKQTNRIKQK